MRIESIEIKNFRQYRDEKVSFPKKVGSKDIHIIIGENGEGKTNILNALTWCLYGEELHLGDKNTAIRTINSQYVDELRQRGERHGEVSVIVRMSLDEENSTMDFIRTATFSITPADAFETSCKVLAVKTGGAKGAEFVEKKEDVDMWVSRYAPREINEYIFFDGELMDQYFKDAQRKTIENGIKDLTQASVLEKTIKAIEAFKRSEIDPLLRRNGDSQVESAQKELELAMTRYKNQEEKLELIHQNITRLKGQIDEFNEKIKGHDNLKDKMQELEKIDSRIALLSKREENNQEDLMRFVREYYVYFSLYPSLKKLHDFIKKQEKAGNLPPKVDRNLIQQIVNNHECSICGSKLDTVHLQHVLSILHRLEVSSVTAAELNKASVALSNIFEKISKYKDRKIQILREHSLVKKDLEDAENRRVELNNFLRTIPNTEEISVAIEQRDTSLRQLEEDTKRIGREQFILATNKKAVEEAQKALEQAMEKNSMMGKYRKQLDFCKKSVDILLETKDEILTECRQEMQKETFDIFNRLIWKKDAFSKVNILDDYSFQLLDQYGDQTLGSCSAAERALLALSFTIALQKTSGHDSLLYIDTPLGRVGEKNRVNFMQVLMEVADTKQVILSFTPTEYDLNVQEQLNKNYSSYCELSFNNGITTIKR
jgi:DNA sulfur modification protein DndD